jgi:hypothetical protein
MIAAVKDLTLYAAACTAAMGEKRERPSVTITIS